MSKDLKLVKTVRELNDLEDKSSKEIEFRFKKDDAFKFMAKLKFEDKSLIVEIKIDEDLVPYVKTKNEHFTKENLTNITILIKRAFKIYLFEL